MTKIRIELEETDLYHAIKSIINHDNADEIAYALSKSIAPMNEATQLFFKTYFGGICPKVLPEGTIVKAKPKDLYWDVDVDKMRELKLLDKNDLATAIIKEFRGFNDSTTYYASYQHVNDSGIVVEKTGFLHHNNIKEVIEDF